MNNHLISHLLQNMFNWKQVICDKTSSNTVTSKARILFDLPQRVIKMIAIIDILLILQQKVIFTSQIKTYQNSL